MIPVARTENLVVQEFEDEIIICEMGSNTTHCLSPIATRVWNYCDGSNTVEDIAKFLEEDLDVSLDSDIDVRGLVWLTIDELQRNGLIKEYLKQPIADSTISRRKVLKRLSIAGGFAAGAMFPAVRSMMMPEPAEASSSKVIETVSDFLNKDKGIQIGRINGGPVSIYGTSPPKEPPRRPNDSPPPQKGFGGGFGISWRF